MYKWTQNTMKYGIFHFILFFSLSLRFEMMVVKVELVQQRKKGKDKERRKGKKWHAWRKKRKVGRKNERVRYGGMISCRT